jgi:hypothetical protein
MTLCSSLHLQSSAYLCRTGLHSTALRHNDVGPRNTCPNSAVQAVQCSAVQLSKLVLKKAVPRPVPVSERSTEAVSWSVGFQPVLKALTCTQPLGPALKGQTSAVLYLALTKYFLMAEAYHL